MQTFLVTNSFTKSVKFLDDKRLKNQRNEALCILRSLYGINLGWQNHPAVRMWRGYEEALVLYGLACCSELNFRGIHTKHMDCDPFFELHDLEKKLVYPPFLYDPKFHSSHKSALLYKDFDFYSKYGWEEKPAVPNAKGQLPYLWPV